MEKTLKKIRIYTISTNRDKYLSAEIDHDTHGNEIRVKTYSEDGELQTEHENIYNAAHQLTGQRDWSGEEGFFLVKKFTYGSDGKLQEETTYYEGDDEPVSTVKHTYSGSVHTEETLDEEGSLIQKVTWERDADNNITRFEFHDLLNNTGESHESSFFAKNILKERKLMDMNKNVISVRTGEHSTSEEGHDVYTYQDTARGVSHFHSEKTIVNGLTLIEKMVAEGTAGKILELQYTYNDHKKILSEDALNPSGESIYRNEYVYNEHHHLISRKSVVEVGWLQYYPDRPVESYHLEEREIEYWD